MRERIKEEEAALKALKENGDAAGSRLKLGPDMVVTDMYTLVDYFKATKYRVPYKTQITITGGIGGTVLVEMHNAV